MSSDEGDPEEDYGEQGELARKKDAAEKKLASRKKSEKFYKCTVAGCTAKNKDKFPGKSFKKHIEQKHQLNWGTFVKVLWNSDGLRQPKLGETLKGADMLNPNLKRIRDLSEAKKQSKKRKVGAPVYHQQVCYKTPVSIFMIF